MALSDIITQLRTGQADFNDVADGLEEIVTVFGPATSFVPTLSGSGSMTVSSAGGGSCRYWQIGNLVIASYYFVDIVTGGTASTDIRASLPVTAQHLTYGMGGVVEDSSLVAASVFILSSTVVRFRKYDSSNFGLGTGRGLRSFFIYHAASSNLE